MAERDNDRLSRRPPPPRGPDDEPEEPSPGERRLRLALWSLLGVLALSSVAMQLNPGGAQQIAYYDFKNRLRAGQVDEVLISDDTLRGRWRNAPAASPGPAPTSAPSPAARPAATPPRPTRPWRYDFETVMLRDEQLLPLLEAQHVRYAATVHPRWPAQVLLFGAVLLFFLLMGRSLLRRLQGQAGGVFAFGRSKGKMVGEGDVTVRFEDVAGVDEAKEELQEVVEFLKSPEKFIRIGARIPKGVLLVGPPGTGKTLLARAVAGEAHVAFFSLSGSEFVEMFVGVGAARVRDLFENAKQSAPCIVFIDELDALGRSRGSNVSNANEEREQTLNQLLVEMDGFESNKGVILLAATNRPEILDRALLRPGRFDRQVLVDRPDRKGRAQILRVHARKVQLAPEVDLDDLAARTPGFAGADLANIINEGALLAARRDKPAVTRAELEEAIERVSAGLERKSRIISPVERRRVAYHEIGHALVGALLPGGSEVTKISIVPRGVGALGYTMKLPTEDRYLMTEAELSAQLAGLLGGRVAEQIVFGDLSTGASNDLQRATELARAMVSEYGMSRAIGPVGLGQERSAFLPTEGLGRLREHGDQLADLVDHEVKRIVESAELEAKMLLTRHRDALEALAQALLEREYLDAASFRGLLDASVGPRPEGPTTVSASRV